MNTKARAACLSSVANRARALISGAGIPAKIGFARRRAALPVAAMARSIAGAARREQDRCRRLRHRDTRGARRVSTHATATSTDTFRVPRCYPSHSERLAGLGLLAERLRYRLRVVRHVHYTLFVDPLIELTLTGRGQIAGARCRRRWSRRGWACRRIGDPHPVIRDGHTVATELVPPSWILDGGARKSRRPGVRAGNCDGNIDGRSGEPRRIVGRRAVE